MQTGQVKVGRRNSILKSSAIGSCIVIAAYNSNKTVGALAHVMLPGNAPGEGDLQKTSYAADAIDEMLNRMAHLGVDNDEIEVCLVGGGNVLKRKNETICQDNVNSVIEFLQKKGIKIKAKALGGTSRRRISFDIERGSIFYAEADEDERLLWETKREASEKINKTDKKG